MSATPQQQFSAATRSQIEGQLAAWTAVNNALLQGVTRLADLNMQAARDMLDDQTALSREFVDSAGPQDFLATAAGQAHPNFERLATYGRQMTEIANELRTEIGKIVQNEVSFANGYGATTMKDLFRQTPFAAAPVSEWMKTALDAANAGYAQLIGTAAQMSKELGDQMPAPTQEGRRIRRK